MRPWNLALMLTSSTLKCEMWTWGGNPHFFQSQHLIMLLGHTSFAQGGGDSNTSDEGKRNFYGTTSSARTRSAVEDSRWRTWAVSWFRCTEEYCLRCFADTLICCACSNMVDFRPKRTICFLATMLIEDLKDWNASVCSSPTRSNTPRTFLCYEEIMNVHPSIESTGMKRRTIRWAWHHVRFYDECKRRYSLKLWKAFNMVGEFSNWLNPISLLLVRFSIVSRSLRLYSSLVSSVSIMAYLSP